MVSSGTAKLIILVVMLTTFYPFFDYGIRGALEAVVEPEAVSEIRFARLNVTSPYSVFHNVSEDCARVEFEITSSDLYGTTWCAAEFIFEYKHLLWDRLGIEIPEVSPPLYLELTETQVIDNWDASNNYTRVVIDPKGGKEQDAYFFIRSNATHYLYATITDSLNAGEIGMLIGGQLPRLETDFFAIVGIVGTSFLTGITAPFTGADYPVVLSLINYIIILLAALALALFLRG